MSETQSTTTAYDVFADQIWTEILAFQEVNRVALKRVQEADPKLYEQVRSVEDDIKSFIDMLVESPTHYGILVLLLQHRDKYLRQMTANLAAQTGTTTH